MTRSLKLLFPGLLLALGISAGMPAATGATDEPSAQSLLFDANYLLPLTAPSRLVYAYSHKSEDPERFGKGFDDEVALKLSASTAGGGEKDVLLDMFTGERERILGPLTRVSGNPVVMMFLERDVTQMNMHVGGQTVYFRNVIRLAFREHAKLEPATFSWNGKQVSGTKIVIQPFLGDPNGDRMALFRTKTYEFIVSDAVPGGIYEIRSTVGDDRPDAKAPVLDTTLTLKGLANDPSKN
jgi:hypothetical protein